jgi:hypothetical protein
MVVLPVRHPWAPRRWTVRRLRVPRAGPPPDSHGRAGRAAQSPGRRPEVAVAFRVTAACPAPAGPGGPGPGGEKPKVAVKLSLLSGLQARARRVPD